ncbi:SDR family NAD(P)-dependent oxidoreductase [Paeniroseomonas aquatica]|uniref:SDR family NAD(P)-dependent oxidoreductase n=1 Tax=Paeniroseomonas aquatica TaxID=373043 RepID=UPI0036214A66
MERVLLDWRGSCTSGRPAPGAPAGSPDAPQETAHDRCHHYPRVALITGASRGIGREIAWALAGRGFSLFLAAEGTPAELDEAVAECRRRGAPMRRRGSSTWRRRGRRRPWSPPPWPASGGWTCW